MKNFKILKDKLDEYNNYADAYRRVIATIESHQELLVAERLYWLGNEHRSNIYFMCCEYLLWKETHEHNEGLYSSNELIRFAKCIDRAIGLVEYSGSFEEANKILNLITGEIVGQLE